MRWNCVRAEVRRDGRRGFMSTLEGGGERGKEGERARWRKSKNKAGSDVIANLAALARALMPTPKKRRLRRKLTYSLGTYCRRVGGGQRSASKSGL